MKLLAVSLAICSVVLALNAGVQGVGWHDDLAEAAIVAEKSSKPMLVVFR